VFAKPLFLNLFFLILPGCPICILRRVELVRRMYLNICFLTTSCVFVSENLYMLIGEKWLFEGLNGGKNTVNIALAF